MTTLGRSTRMPVWMVSQSPLRVPYLMLNAGSAAGVTDVLARKSGAYNGLFHPGRDVLGDKVSC